MSNNAILSDEDVINDPPVFLITKTPKKIRRTFDLEFKAKVVMKIMVKINVYVNVTLGPTDKLLQVG